ncbi:MAG: glycosyltransferase family 9 protein [Kiritimatiellae bacterium]|nr:glycosyltransferase family 9 protein [Kiritimatiellia bacterium]
MTQPDTSPRFLVIRGGAIGDFIVTLPVLQALRARWPDAHLSLWAYPHVARLALLAGLANDVTSLDRADMARFFVPSPTFTDAQLALVPTYHIVFNYLHDPEGQVRSNLLLAGAQQVISCDPIVAQAPAARHFLAPLMQLALYDQPDIPALDFPPPLLAEGRARLDQVLSAASTSPAPAAPIALHPGAGAPGKRWPLDGYLAVAHALQRRHLPVLWILGEADADLADALDQALPDAPRLRNLPLTDLAPALAHCRAYLGNDSGIAHLAAALAVPTLTLFGPTDPGTWAPRSRAPARHLRAPSSLLPNLSFSDVLSALLALLDTTSAPPA